MKSLCAITMELGPIAVAHLQLAGGLSQSEVWYVRTIQSVFAWLSIRWIRLNIEKREIFRVACTRVESANAKCTKKHAKWSLLPTTHLLVAVAWPQSGVRDVRTRGVIDDERKERCNESERREGCGVRYVRTMQTDFVWN